MRSIVSCKTGSRLREQIKSGRIIRALKDEHYMLQKEDLHA